MQFIKTHNLGYPRIGEQRELKKATEAYWKGKLPLDELLATGKQIRKTNWLKQHDAGIDLIPVNDFSFYDQTLDMSCLLGNIPPRFQWSGEKADVNTAFMMARGTTIGGTNSIAHEDCCDHQGMSSYASEMTKWFDTNYHYIVPEFHQGTRFSLCSTKVFDEFVEAKLLGVHAKPVLLGPVSYLLLGKGHGNTDFDPLSLLDPLLEVYAEIVIKLEELGAEWIQMDEPVFSLDLTVHQLKSLERSYHFLSRKKGAAKLLVANYFGPLRYQLDHYLNLDVDALHFDLARGIEDLDNLLNHYPDDKILSAGIVEGRNVWRNEYDASLQVLEKLQAAVGANRLWVAPSCSLMHSPVTLKNENSLDEEIKSWLSFADEKLIEVVELSRYLDGDRDDAAIIVNRQVNASRKASARIHHAKVKARLAAITPNDYKRQSSFEVRQQRQIDQLKLPEFPTTTIGSFPQTNEVRQARAKWKKGEWSLERYEQYLKIQTASCVKWQDEIGLDVLVHGEFERNDMVEYFGEYLEGFVFTSHAWVQSYGSRYVKPPIIYGDVSRQKPMTVEWSKYAQSLTQKPMKGMLTGPVTILQWSFVRDDQPRSITAFQIALAIRDEVMDLEQAGIGVIQIDEPAIREGLPLREQDWESYLTWAGQCFRLSASGVKDETQIHTHMCYAEFNDIIHAIAALDADVITIETSRSNMELLDAFVHFQYPNEIGPGVYDIHSPRIPSVDEMVRLMRKAEEVLPRRNLWVNPDCGLKTRSWEEVKTSLVHMVSAAKKLRQQVPLSLPN